MINCKNCHLILGVLLFTLVSSVRAESWGTLSGQFVVQGTLPEKSDVLVSKEFAVCGTDIPDDSLLINTQSRGIANIFVYLNHAPDRIHPALQNSVHQTLEITSENCRFVPHALIAQTTQPICFSTDEGFLHHIRAVSFMNPSISQAVADQAQATFQFANSDRFPIKVTCDTHSWMQSWWLILDHPYAAVSDKDGRFKISNLPSGEHTLTVWHERCGYVVRDWKVTVREETETTLNAMKVPIEKFQD